MPRNFNQCMQSLTQTYPVESNAEPKYGMLEI